MYDVSELRHGLKIEIDNNPYIITMFDFCKPGKGTALYRCKLKNMLNGSTMDRTFRPGDKVDTPNIVEREVHYAYKNGDEFVFTDAETFEEYHVSGKVLDKQQYFLLDNMDCKLLIYNDKPIDITLPVFVEKEITWTEPGARGDTATNVTKPARLDNGYEIRVPLFLNQGDIVKIDTRTGEYSERVNRRGF
jgi:elongation factor P